MGEWANDPDNYVNGYAYENSFAKMWEGLGKESFRENMGKAPKDKKPKNS